MKDEQLEEYADLGVDIQTKLKRNFVNKQEEIEWKENMLLIQNNGGY